MLQLRVTLEDVRPAVWRRVLVPGGVRLSRFHQMLQAAMGWTDSHLHQFRIDGVLWGKQFDEWRERERDETTVTVGRAIGATQRFFYDYDFGDSWEHEILVEDRWTGGRGLKHAVCLAGERSCPPEDVGGVPGYERLLRVLADPTDEEHEFLVAWSGGDFDPDPVRSGRHQHRAAAHPRPLNTPARAGVRAWGARSGRRWLPADPAQVDQGQRPTLR